MFILTDGKNYVMENPIQKGRYMSTTSSAMATEFSWKQARALLQSKKKYLSWVRGYYMVDKKTGQIENDVPKYSNADAFCGNRDLDFEYDVVNEIQNEIDQLLKLSAWDKAQLSTYNAKLTQGLQFYDSAISDVYHVRMDKRPPAHIRTKIDGLLNDLEEKRRDIKQSISYLSVLDTAVQQSWPLCKIKEELKNKKFAEYKGRTKYFEVVSELLKDY